MEGEKTGGKTWGKNGKRWMKIVATTSLPAVDCPNADRWNTARSCPFYLCGIFLERKGEEGSLIFPPHNDEIVLNGLKHDKIILPPSCVSLEMGLTDEILVMGSHKVEELGKPSKEKTGNIMVYYLNYL